MGDETLLERILNGDEEPKDLPLALLQRITNDFSEERKIGQGGFGVVYKGVLRNGILVAVKRMYLNENTIDDVSFRREISSLMKINHKNVVRFLGFCSHAYHTSIKEAGSTDLNFVNIRERLLCLEYIGNGSLDKHITDELRGFEWETRYEIIIGICKGLRYLHEEKKIVHMDLKPANILLDGTYMVPKITDFGLSRSNKNSHTMGLRLGTRGYLAPEYENSGKISFKSDVYSLGAIIFELVTGSMGVPDVNNVLRRWRHRWNKPPTLLQYQQVTRCIDIAVRCKQQEPGHRPSISEIISTLSTNGHTSQISPLYDEDDMLGIKPLELRLPSELKEISCSVELTNNTTNCVAFNIQPSSPPRYSAQPDKGIVQPRSKYGVKITMPPQDMHADKFIVKSMKVSVGLRDEDITECMFEEVGKVVDEVNLMVVYEPTKPQENCKIREDTNMPAEEVPEAEMRMIVEFASRKGKICSGENAGGASTDINSSVQGQRIKQTKQCNFYPPQSVSHHSLAYLLMPLLDSVAAKGLSYFTVNSPVVFRLSMNRKMKDALEMINELVAKMNSFHFLQHLEAPSVVHPQTHSHVDESEIIGRQDEKDLVVKILLDHSHNNNNNNVIVLPIVGMGGIGKTTLAQLVHNDQRVMHHFDLVLWFCVSGKFVIKEIIRSIIEVATMKKCDLTQMEALWKELHGVLGKKRYLLVLDDVWNEDRQKWDAMRTLLCSHACSGSAIIVTSRSDHVASIMGTLPACQISLLDEDQSWELFHRNTFGRETENQEVLISMAKSIVEKCKGLPLAIKTIAALLRLKKSQSEWSSVLDSDVWKNDILTTGILPALQLSYDHLSLDAKICFSFCAIFPKGRLMDKYMLIQLWIANEFIASETRGQQIFDVLVCRCFLEDVQIQENLLSRHSGNFIYRPTPYMMHDLMHDLADSVSENDCSILQECSSSQESPQGSTYVSSLQHEVRHLSLDYVNDNTIAAMKEILAPQPRTILVFQGKFGTENHLSIAKSKFVSLRALKTRSFETHMTNLKHLRFLDCSNSNISALPEDTTILYSLQTLNLNGCRKLTKLPKRMRYMSSLRHIFLVGCYNLKLMPQGIGQLNSLQTLTHYVIDSDAGHGIDQLKDLNLGGALSLFELRKVHSAEIAKEGNMYAKHNLKRLALDWSSGRYSPHVGDEVDSNAEGILEALRPHETLEALLLRNYTGTKLSSWMHKSALLEHLSELCLSRCMNCQDLPPLWQMPSLEYLHLDCLDILTSICVGNNATENGESCISPPPFFPKLDTMMLTDMHMLMRWHQEVTGKVAVVSFPQLKKLRISGCPRVMTLPEGLVHQLPALEELRIIDCPKLEGAFSGGGAYWDLVEAIPKKKLV